MAVPQQVIYNSYYPGKKAILSVYILCILQHQFVSEVEDSGVLVYLSSRWLCEVYQQVLCLDLLTTTACSSNQAIHNLLSGESRLRRKCGALPWWLLAVLQINIISSLKSSCDKLLQIWAEWISKVKCFQTVWNWTRLHSGRIHLLNPKQVRIVWRGMSN